MAKEIEHCDEMRAGCAREFGAMGAKLTNLDSNQGHILTALEANEDAAQKRETRFMEIMFGNAADNGKEGIVHQVRAMKIAHSRAIKLGMLVIAALAVRLVLTIWGI